MEWDGTSALTAGDILKEPVDPEQKSALSEAKEFLLQELADGPLAAEQVEKYASGAQISMRTLKRAKRSSASGHRSGAMFGTGNWLRRSPKKATPPPLARLAPLAPLARMPKPDSLIQLTYGKRAKDAKRAKGTTHRAASTDLSAARDVTCTIQRTLAGSSK